MGGKNKAGTIITAVICILLLAVAGLFGFMYMTGDADYRGKKAENAATLERLQGELASIKEPDVTVEEVEAKVYSAGDAGSRVADFQNLYRSTADNDGLTTIAENMDKYLDDDSKNWRVPWYAGKVNRNGVVWKFETTYSFTEKSIPVLWTCRDSDNVLLAYATADYIGDTKKFSNVNVELTAVGYNSILGEDGSDGSPAPSPTPTPDVFGLVDSVTGEGGNSSSDVSSGESSEENVSSDEAESLDASSEPASGTVSGAAAARLDDEGRDET